MTAVSVFVGDAERQALQVLASIADPCDAAVHRRIAAVGVVQVVDELRRGGSPLRRAASYAARLPAVDLDQQRLIADRLGARLVVPGDDAWPTIIDDLGERRPFALWFKGPVELATATQGPSVAIVGARAATHYGEGVAVEFAADLTRRGWLVVSGGAYGIDAAAHRGALAVEGATAAVLANGIDLSYPRGHDALLARIGQDGVVVTELPPGATPTRAGFLARNRLIAALARVTVVVEAAVRSGSMTTVARAIELGRDVAGVPGPITSAQSVGVHVMLRDGAVMVTEPDHVVELAAPWSVVPVADDPARSVPRDVLGPAERAVLDAFPARGPISADAVAVKAGLSASEAVQALGRLDLEAWVEFDGSNYRLTAKARG
jgi:DNA processing protein